MATSRLASQLRRRPPSLSSLSPPSLTSFHHRTPQPPPPPPPFPSRGPTLLSPRNPYHPTGYFLHHSNSFHTDSYSSQHSDQPELSRVTESVAELQFFDLGFVIAGSDEYFLPVRLVVSLLDWFHDLTGLPWWIAIASSALVLRVVLFPVLVLQINMVKRIFELLHKLPPPLPPPLSGRSYMEQISLFWKEKQALGCPSFLWFFAYASVQGPCFLTWMISIRKMSLDHHPGFDLGGALWFQNLAETPHGLLGLIFPSLVAGLHYMTNQLAFRKTSVGMATSLLGLLMKNFKQFLDFMTIPTFFVGIFVPQGSLVHWITNATLTVTQQLCLSNPVVCKKLGLPDNRASTETATPEKMISAATSQDKIAIPNLSPQELFALSVRLLAKGQNDVAIPFLKSTLNKDPEFVRALLVMGGILLQKGLLADANEYLERAISKLCHVGHLTEVEDVYFLILASQWAGIACIQQGKNAEGMVHLQRVASLKEPADSRCKAYYFNGLLLLGRALNNEGRKDEAAKFLSMAASYNLAHTKSLQQREDEGDSFVSDLVNSRRGDYY